MSDNYISVSQVNNYIRDIFYNEMLLQNICVFGEVSSYNISNGIAYFNLKDENGILSCVLFGANNFESPNVGDMVLVKGSISYYIKGGRLSFNATSIMPYGKGMLYEKFLELKNRLEKMGFFDESRKKKIPKNIKKIGVVSSETGAVIRDIIDVTSRRNNSIDIVLYPVKVQGVGADFEISKGIDFFSNYKDVDVVIVARGGGSMEDLEPFNSETVAVSTYNCKKPIVSAVGHETDFTIIDFVSDLRAPTPSAAAELVAWDKSLYLENINKYLLRMYRSLDNKLELFKKDINIYSQNIFNNINLKLTDKKNKIDFICNRLYLIDDKIEFQNNNLDKVNLKINNLNPKRLSDIGYSKVLQDKKVLSSVEDLDVCKNINISMIDGDIDCKVV